MRLLCVANWSEGRDTGTLAAMRSALQMGRCAVHYDGSDEDHNRIVTAFSGDADDVRDTLLSIAGVALERIDMSRHHGVHPRIGALDVCPFLVLEGDQDVALGFVRDVGLRISDMYDLPIFLYERSETGKHAADLPSLRSGQYEGLVGRALAPDFGPPLANSRLGATVMGLRDWLLAMNVNLPEASLPEAKTLAREVRIERDKGNPMFAGVRALGLPLPRRGMSQVSMNLTQPDSASADEIIRWIGGRVTVLETELIGVIRRRDLATSTLLPIADAQIIS